ncbi:MAG: hypothetical protein R3E68_04465 [Burkholderiaceae bacterium]
MKFTEGAFADWGYALAKREFGAEPIDGGPLCSFKIPRPARKSSSGRHRRCVPAADPAAPADTT